MHFKSALWITLTGLFLGLCRSNPVWADVLRVSDNHRFLVHSDGSPFFYLADTAWELFHRATREEAELYLKTRARQGFTVIQAVALSELQGTTIANAYGHFPLEGGRIDKPLLLPGKNDDYWDMVDFVIERANRLGLYVGLLPSWGSYWHDNGCLNAGNARQYAHFLADRYKDADIVWILGGDRAIENEQQKNVMRELAAGLREGGSRQPITFHPCGANGSSRWLHGESWLDFNMRQNGHTDIYTGRYSETLTDYRREPAKPVIDGESTYEDHPIDFNAQRFGHSTATDVRHALYWDLFNGACGHTYGHHSVWQWFNGGGNPVNMPLLTWREALTRPGAEQMQHARRLLESRPYLTRIPCPELIKADRFPTNVPGEGRHRFTATADSNGSYAMVYVPVARSFTLDMKRLKGSRIRVWWFNPRTGKASRSEVFENNAESRRFTPPDTNNGNDWVLVLDDAACHYPAPGKRIFRKS